MKDERCDMKPVEIELCNFIINRINKVSLSLLASWPQAESVTPSNTMDLQTGYRQRQPTRPTGSSERFSGSTWSTIGPAAKRIALSAVVKFVTVRWSTFGPAVKRIALSAVVKFVTVT